MLNGVVPFRFIQKSHCLALSSPDHTADLPAEFLEYIIVVLERLRAELASHFGVHIDTVSQSTIMSDTGRSRSTRHTADAPVTLSSHSRHTPPYSARDGRPATEGQRAATQRPRRPHRFLLGTAPPGLRRAARPRCADRRGRTGCFWLNESPQNW